jgi:peptidoglycan/xylan/chitin deacetylase (PgdA/CDA1 family)
MLKSVGKLVYYNVLSAAGFERRRLRSLTEGNKIAVLNLHRITEVDNPYWPPLRPEIFESLLVFLKSEFDVRRLEHTASKGNGKPIAVLSFDDGYYDFIEYALPLLEKYGLPANMNIIPECAQSGEPIWNVKLYDFLNEAPQHLIEMLPVPGLEGLSPDNPRSKLEIGLKVSRHLKTRPAAERYGFWQEIEEVMQRSQFTKTRMMTTDDIRSIADRVEIGVHSYSHESMGYEAQDFFENDFEKCRTFFENVLKLPLSIYAFPNGSYRQEQVEHLRRQEIKHILLVEDRFATLGADVMERLTIYGDTAAEVRMRALGL